MRILYVGNLIKRKGVDYLISAFRGIKNSNLRLTIVGKGEEEFKLRELARGDRRIVFLGHLGGEAKARVFSEANVFVLPSLHEPWGFVVNEALEFGLPVITTSAVGAADYLVENNGIVVPPGNIPALRDAIQKISTNEEQRQKMEKESVKMAQRWSLEDMASPFIKAVNYSVASQPRCDQFKNDNG